MGIDLNPLSEFPSYTVFHILVAFQYSEDAFTTTISPDIGKCGDIINAAAFGGQCGGNAIVLINEMKSNEASVNFCETSWSFFAPNNPRTSSYVGSMEIVDRSAFLFADRLKKFTTELDMSIHHLTMAWVPVFVVRPHNADFSERLNINPMHFHVTKFSQNISNPIGRAYVMDFVASYNTHGTGPQFSSLNQVTVNHKDGNTINTIPTPSQPSSGIRPTKEEDRDKIDARSARLRKVKYIQTLGDFCDSFAYALDNQKVRHKKQLQRLMAQVRDDYTDKIKADEQVSEPIPMDYSIEIDSYYRDMKIDNRNLPFDQVEQDQRVHGISSITFPVASTIMHAINTVFKMSKTVSLDHEKLPAITYKMTTTTNRTCSGQYKIHTKIKKYISPYNSSGDVKTNYAGIDTGPGEGVLGNVIQYTYQDKSAQDNNVIALSYSVAPQYQLQPVESMETQEDSQDVYGNREPVTSQRYSRFSSFFRHAFSGLRTLGGLFTDNGMEDSAMAASQSNFNQFQQTVYNINVVGNPSLLNDINRNPLDVINNVSQNGLGQYLIYSNVETDPMYIKLKVYLDGDKKSGFYSSDNDSSAYYYDGYLHLYKIRNVFSPGAFAQFLTCGRTDENR